MNQAPLRRIIDRMSFLELFFVWIGFITLFGLLYYLGKGFLISTSSYTFLDAIHYSFTSATTLTGPTITATEIGKLLSIVETVISVIIYSITISKLVSLRQSTLLGEVYKISFNEHVNRLRTMLHVFRSDMDRVIEYIQEGKLTQLKLKKATPYFNLLQNTIEDIDRFLHERNTHSPYIKGVDFFTFELLLNSIIISVDKVFDFFDMIKEKKISSKKAFSTQLRAVYSFNERIITKYEEIDEKAIKNKLAVLSKMNKRLQQEITNS